MRWQILIAVLGLVLVGGLLAGQGRSGTTTVFVPEQGGVYTEALVGGPRWLNPLLDYANPVDRDIDRLIFSGLVRFDATGRPQPDLAHWTISADQLTYQFILKPNLKWHDGQPLTAADVAFTVGLLKDPAYPGPADVGRLWQAVQVKVVNAQTIEFTLPEVFAPFLDYTAFGILPQHRLTGVSAATLPQAEFNRAPIGSGPFMFVQWTAGPKNSQGGLTLAAFADYSGAQPKLGQIQFGFYTEAAAAFQAYQAGEVLGVSRLVEPELAEALRLPDLGLYTARLPQYTLIYLNLKDAAGLPFFQDKRARQALLLGLNRQAMVNDILHGQALMANSPILPGLWAYNPNLPVSAYNPAQAADLLTAAGWVFPEGAVAGTDTYVRQKDNVAFAFNLIVPEEAVHLAIAQAAQKTWADLGVKVTLVTVPAADLRANYLVPRAYQAVLADLSFAGTPDPDPYPLWHETQIESGQNYSGFNDRATSEYLEQARLTTDLATRARRYHSFQSRFADQVPALLLYYPVYNYGVSTKVGGVQVSWLTEPSDRFNNVTEWYIGVTRRTVEQPDAAATLTPPAP